MNINFIKIPQNVWRYSIRLGSPHPIPKAPECPAVCKHTNEIHHFVSKEIRHNEKKFSERQDMIKTIKCI